MIRRSCLAHPSTASPRRGACCCAADSGDGAADAPPTPWRHASRSPPRRGSSSSRRPRSPAASSASSEAVAIALDNQPTIQPRRATTWPRSSAWTRPCRPCCPQLSGQWTGFQQKSACQVTGRGHQTATVTRPSTCRRTATVTASQLLFDFGKTWAATDAAKANSRVRARERGAAEGPHRAHREGVVLQPAALEPPGRRQRPGARPRRAEPAERQGLLRGGHAAASST